MLRERRGFSNYPDRPTDSARKARCASTTQTTPEEITIRFVGDVEQNIQSVVGALNCEQGTRQEFASILRIYAGKIDKLREERDFYRELLCLSEERQNEETLQVQQQISLLQEQLDQMNLKNNCENCTCFDQSEFQTSKFTEHPEGTLSRATLRSFAQHPPPEEEILIDSSKLTQQNGTASLQVSQGSQRMHASVSEEQLGQLMLKYNITTEQLGQILQQYDRENKQAYEMFDSERQRQLYRLGQRMQKDLWNRKIIKDIKKITEYKPK